MLLLLLVRIKLRKNVRKTPSTIVLRSSRRLLLDSKKVIGVVVHSCCILLLLSWLGWCSAEIEKIANDLFLLLQRWTRLKLVRIVGWLSGGGRENGAHIVRWRLPLLLRRNTTTWLLQVIDT